MKVLFRRADPGAGDYLILGLFLAIYVGLAGFILMPHHAASRSGDGSGAFLPSDGSGASAEAR